MRGLPWTISSVRELQEPQASSPSAVRICGIMGLHSGVLVILDPQKQSRRACVGYSFENTYHVVPDTVVQGWFCSGSVVGQFVNIISTCYGSQLHMLCESGLMSGGTWTL